MQLQCSFFPIREAQLNAQIEYATVNPGIPVKVGSAMITPILPSHPVLNFGYRIDCDGQSIFFTGDYEPRLNIYALEDEEYASKQGYGHGTYDSAIKLATEAKAKKLFCTHHENHP